MSLHDRKNAGKLFLTFFFDPSPRSIAQFSDIMLAASAATCARQQRHGDGDEVIKVVFARESVSGLITVARLGA